MRKHIHRAPAWLLALGTIVFAAGCGDKRPAAGISAGVFTGDIAAIDSVLTANRGRWVLVNVWATWCRPCVAETADLVAFTNSMAGRPFSTLGISADSFTDEDTIAVRKVSEFQTKYAIPYPNLVYLGSIDDLASRFELSGAIPTSILFDPQGKPAQQFVGKLEQAQFAAIEKQVG